MKTNRYVTFEQAVLLKELGYQQEQQVEEYIAYSLEDMSYTYEQIGCYDMHGYASVGDMICITDGSCKILSEKRFFNEDDIIDVEKEDSELFHTHIVLAPTLHEAADWLRDKGLYTYPKLNALNKWYAVVHFLEYAETVRQEEMFDDFNTALSHGIDYCLSVLKYKEK